MSKVEPMRSAKRRQHREYQQFRRRTGPRKWAQLGERATRGERPKEKHQ